MPRKWSGKQPINMKDTFEISALSTVYDVNVKRIKYLMIDHYIKTRKQLSQMSNVRESILRQMLNEEIATKRMLMRVAGVLGVQWEELVKR